MSDYQYEEDSQQSQSQNEEKPVKKKYTKNQQIYGDFEQAYQEQLEKPQIARQMKSYNNFKMGNTIDRYQSEIQITLPISKPKSKSKAILQDQQQDDKPMLGKFNLNSFLNQFSEPDVIQQQENQDSEPQGLNNSIITALELVKIGQEIQEQITNIQDMKYEDYMKLNQKQKPKIEPKYKTKQQKQKAQQFKQGYGIGFKMLEKMGYKVTKGLGKDQTGISKPVEAVMKTAFTMKDNQAKSKNEEDKESQQQQMQLSVYQEVFQYRSKNKRINDLLSSLKSSYQKLEKEIFYNQLEIQSVKKQSQLKDSLWCQNLNEKQQVQAQIKKLISIQRNIYNCQDCAQLAINYKLDFLYTKNIYDTFSRSDFQFVFQNAENLLSKLFQQLNRFYLAKTTQKLKQFHQTTAIQEKMHKKLKQKQKNQTQVIDLDDLEDKNLNQVTTLSIQDEEKIYKFLELVIFKGIMPKINILLDTCSSIEKVKDLRIIDILQIIKKYSKKSKSFQDYVKLKIIPKCNSYLQEIDLNKIQTNNVKKTPDIVIFPWFTILKPSQINLTAFFRRISGKLWKIEENSLLNLIKPWMKFLSQEEKDTFFYLYLAPRILAQIQNFDMNSPNLNLLNGFVQYSKFLSRQISKEILQNTIMLQIHQAYKKYKQQLDEKEIKKWLSKWKKFIDKAIPGYFQQYFQEYSIYVQ